MEVEVNIAMSIMLTIALVNAKLGKEENNVAIGAVELKLNGYPDRSGLNLARGLQTLRIQPQRPLATCRKLRRIRDKGTNSTTQAT